MIMVRNKRQEEKAAYGQDKKRYKSRLKNHISADDLLHVGFCFY